MLVPIAFLGANLYFTLFMFSARKHSKTDSEGSIDSDSDYSLSSSEPDDDESASESD